MDNNRKMIINLLYLFSICITLSVCERLLPSSSIQKKPLILSPGWSSSSSSNGNLLNKQSKNSIIKNTPRTLVIQIRSDTAMPSLILKQRAPQPHHHKHQINYHSHLSSTRIARPIKMAISPHFFIKSGSPSITKHLLRKHKPITKTNNSSVKPPDDYIYKKPFTSSLTHHHHHTPTIENAIHLSQTHFEPIHAVPAPNLAINYNDEETHSYQVTEDHTNDQTIHDPFSGQHKYYAPDPDPSLPAAKLKPNFDPFNTPSNGKPYPLDVQSNYLSSSGFGSGTPVQVQPLIQFLTPIIHPAYHEPAKLQQIYASNAASFSREPLSVQNPTYLVTQSNNLFNQHQQQLFNPNPNYLNTNFLNADQVHEVASTGQIVEATKNQGNQLQPEANNSPTYAALIGAASNANHLTSNEINQNHPEGGFLISNYYDNTQNLPQSHQQDLHYASQEYHTANDRSIPHAHWDLHNQLIVQNAQQYAYDDDPIQSQTETSTDAHEEHQKLLEQHLGTTPLRIFVPDDSEYHGDSNQILQKRSDDYSGETTKKMDNEYSDDYYSMEESKETNKF